MRIGLDEFPPGMSQWPDASTDQYSYLSDSELQAFQDKSSKSNSAVCECNHSLMHLRHSETSLFQQPLQAPVQGDQSVTAVV